METPSGQTVDEPPTRMLTFRALQSLAPDVLGARLGRLVVPARKTIQTPHYVALASRGAVPHLSPDTARQHTDLGGVHVALEDCEYLSAPSTND